MLSEPFALTGTPKPVRQKFPQQQRRQTVLLCGLNDSPGQADLFPTDGELPPEPLPAAEPIEPLPIFRKLAEAGSSAARELIAQVRAIDAPPAWPHGIDRYRQTVYHLLTKYGVPDLPRPSTAPLQAALDRGILPGDLAATILRADGDDCHANFAANEATP